VTVAVHRMVRHAAVRELPGYDPHMCTAIGLEGASTDRSSQHGRAVTVLLESDAGGTLGAELELADAALSDAGVPRRVRKRGRRALESYFFEELGLEADAATPRPGEGRAAIAAPSDPEITAELYEGLAELGGLITSGDYEQLAAMSSVHAPEDLKRRAEDDVAGALTVPPLDALPAAVWTQTGEDTVSVVVELWTGDRVANLHVAALVTDASSSEPQLRFEDLRP
jgi:hypothetical protein